MLMTYNGFLMVMVRVLSGVLRQTKPCKFMDFSTFTFYFRSYSQLISNLDELKRIYEDDEISAG